MNKVLIVDDEYIVRMDIRTLINWEAKGFELTEDAVDGFDALSKIDQYQPDIVLLDISMPGMDGIKLLRQLKAKAYQGQIIILSCHDDFDHVKEALLLGAQEYLLKHKLEPSMLENALANIVKNLEENKRKHDQLIHFESASEDSLLMRRKNFFQQLLRGYLVDNGSVQDKLQELKFSFFINHSIVIIVRIEDFALEKQRLGSRSFDQMKQQLSSRINDTVIDVSTGYCYDTEDGELLLFLGFSAVPSFLYLQNLLYSLSNQLLELIKLDFNKMASIGVSNPCTNIQFIAESYKEAQEAVNGVFFLNNNRIIQYSDVKAYANKPQKAFKEYEDRLLLAINGGKLIQELIQEIYRDLLQQQVSLSEIKSYNFEFISFLKKIQRDSGILEQNLFGNGRSPYETINLLETADEVVGYLSKVITNMSELKRVMIPKQYRKDIASAVEFMKENYTTNLSLETVALHINMNSAYFSNLFKKETNENFVAYLQKIRMEKAKVLLKTTSDKVYDIASQVGIDNYHYFCKTFKLFTGMTPVQYRQQEKH